jgi:hypothetical protein
MARLVPMVPSRQQSPMPRSVQTVRMDLMDRLAPMAPSRQQSPTPRLVLSVP